jgi:predicted N-acetyltransferase YhbS
MSTHDLSGFRSTEPELDDWLRRRAIANEIAGASRTYVVCDENVVVGYYAIANGSIEASAAPGRVRRNMPSPIPVMVLARLAVDQRWEGRGIGLGLVKDCLARTLNAAEIAGIRALVVHAKNDQAKAFYMNKCGFIEAPSGPLDLIITLAEARIAFGL